MSRVNSTPFDRMSRSELLARTVCAAGAIAIGTMSLFGIVGLELVSAAAEYWHPGVFGQLCVAVALLSAAVGSYFVGAWVNRASLALFGLRPWSHNEHQ
jgi:hypothetical protein